MWDKVKWFWRYYRNYKYVLAVLILLTPVQVAIHVVIPRIIEFTIDYAKTGTLPPYAIFSWLEVFAGNIGVSTVTLFAALIAILGLDTSLLYAYVQGHRAWMNMRLEWLFRQAAFDNITYKGPDFFNRFRVGDLVTRMTDDVAEKLSWFACSGIFRLDLDRDEHYSEQLRSEPVLGWAWSPVETPYFRNSSDSAISPAQ